MGHNHHIIHHKLKSNNFIVSSSMQFVILKLWVFSLVYWDVIRYYQVEKYGISYRYVAFIISVNLEDFDSRNIK